MENGGQLKAANDGITLAINLIGAIETLVIPEHNDEMSPKTQDILTLSNMLRGTLLDISGCIGDIEGTNQEDETLEDFQKDIADTGAKFTLIKSTNEHLMNPNSTYYFLGP